MAPAYAFTLHGNDVALPTRPSTRPAFRRIELPRLLMWLSLLLLLCSAPAWSQQPPSGPQFEVSGAGAPEALVRYRRSAALVIGQVNYLRERPLPYSNNSANMVKDALQSQGFEVTTVWDQNQRTLRQSIEEFVAAYGDEPESRLVIYYAGHAFQDSAGNVWLLSVDSMLPVPGSPPPLTQVDLSWAAVQERFKTLRARHILFLLDACGAGGAAPSVLPQPQSTLSDTLREPLRLVIASTASGESAQDSILFAQRLASGLQGGADLNRDTYVTGRELASFLQVQFKDDAQSPQFSFSPASSSGDIVFSSGLQRTAWLSINAVPPPEDIRVNGLSWGAAPKDGMGVQVERARIEVRWHTGETARSREFSLSPGDRLSCVGVKQDQKICCLPRDPIAECSPLLRASWSDKLP